MQRQTVCPDHEIEKAGETMECYLDNSATTRCFDSAAMLMAKVMCEDYGNPSSMHKKGMQAEQYLRYARDVIAKNLKVSEKEIFFTSGGTESDNLAIFGSMRGRRRSGRHPAASAVRLPGPAVPYLRQFRKLSCGCSSFRRSFV